MAAGLGAWHLLSRRFTLVVGIATGLIALVDIHAELSAQTILPSQVTPQTLRPSGTGGGALYPPDTEDLQVLPNSKIKSKKQLHNSPRPTDRTLEKKRSPGT